MKKFENVILYLLLTLILIALIYSLSIFFNKGYSQEKYDKFASAERSNKCETPSGYTDQEWKEHMSHHPQQYKECLG